MSFLPGRIFLFFLFTIFLLLALQIFLPGQIFLFFYWPFFIIGTSNIPPWAERPLQICRQHLQKFLHLYILAQASLGQRAHAVAAHKVRSNFETGDPTHTHGEESHTPFFGLYWMARDARVMIRRSVGSSQTKELNSTESFSPSRSFVLMCLGVWLECLILSITHTEDIRCILYTTYIIYNVHISYVHIPRRKTSAQY